MKIGAVITGDIVKSTKMTAEERTEMLCLLQYLPAFLNPLTKIKLEIFRGDGFQIMVADVYKSLRTAIAIRAAIRSHKFQRIRTQWDARLSLGVGTLDYERDRLATSDGQAYRDSGRGLDSMGKARLNITTPWNEMNEELRVSTAFADDIISRWTQSQSRIMTQYLITDLSHAEIGSSLNISRQMVDKALKAGKENLLNLYLNRFEELLQDYMI